MLCNVLIEHLFIEFQRILLCEVIVKLSTMGLNNITVLGPSVVHKAIIITFNIGIFHCLLMVESGILVLNKSLCGGLVGGLVGISIVVLIYCLVKGFSLSSFSFLLELSH